MDRATDRSRAPRAHHREGDRARSLGLSVALLLITFLPLLGAGCSSLAPAPQAAPAEPTRSAAAEPADTRFHLTLLHFNDIYEITPLGGGKVGGPARVATLRDRLLAEDPNTLTLLGGDLLSPSAMGTAKVDGQRLAGRQMVAVLNSLGLDVTTFGNHELDLKKDELVERLGEAEFDWVCGNITWADGSALPHVQPYQILTLDDSAGGGAPALRLGLIGAVLPTGAPDYVTIADPVATLATQASQIRDQVDVLIALTHLALEDDARLAATVPEIDLILGGHEHENWQLWRGADGTPILKGDANVKTVYVVDLAYDHETGTIDVEPELVWITDQIPDQPATAAVAAHWTQAAFDGFRQDGFEPEQTVAVTTISLDGREASVRNRSTALTDLVGQAMVAAGAADSIDGAVYNSGSIRIDDVLAPGPVTQYDVIRILPFGGDIVTVEIDGGLLAQVLDQGVANRGTGGFLQYAGIERSEQGAWVVGGSPLSSATTYRVALTDFLLTGRETGLDYLTEDNPGIQLLGTRGDIRRAVIGELGTRFPAD